ncbi:predicted protein [Thalassiosira pseudonana CCMP1335]|jgi:hypothetical protein|uniref:Uncharacterized protein n=1 Tax=Thalassiosira pseudonana TaxID=35128 RepID=B8CD79_THAPS|nr:predicted protein [Thalassiosira pseudonana CCMP1335]EED88562.1 predicted protein [Thalassiosira pseudonana CCMP1335]
MCKIGILLIGIDLYLSAYHLFRGLILTRSTNGLAALAAHLVALMALVLAFRGRIGRHVVGRIVLPVEGVRILSDEGFIALMDESKRDSDDVLTILMGMKSVMFLGVVAKMALGKDVSCVGEKEWFPWQHSGVVEGGEGRDAEKKDD